MSGGVGGVRSNAAPILIRIVIHRLVESVLSPKIAASS
jgi:hypothetical protein